MNSNITIKKLNFNSSGLNCAADFYAPFNATGKLTCIVMGHGFTGTKDQLAPYAMKFAEAGMAVLTFDYRYFGESDGKPRQIIDIKKQMEDWKAAINLARSLETVNPNRIVLWGSSLSGGYVINLGSEDSSIAGIVAQVPAIDKSTKGMSIEGKAKMEREGISLFALIMISLKSIAAGIYDAIRGLIGLSPYYMPVFGKPGSVAGFTDPACEKYSELFAKAGSTWQNQFAPRFLFGVPKYKQGTAERIKMPLLICVAEKDTEANPEMAIDIATKAPHGKFIIYPVTHFEVYFGKTFEQIVSDQTKFFCALNE